MCDQTKELQSLYGSMTNNAKWIVSSSGRYMFVRFDTGHCCGSSKGFLANIHYGKAIKKTNYYRIGAIRRPAFYKFFALFY